MDNRITIITLGVKDLKGMREFYSNVLGLPEHPSTNISIVFYQMNGFRLSLYPRDLLADDAGLKSTGSGFKGFTLSQNLRSEKEVDETISKLRSKGVKILKDPQKVFWGGYSGYFQDPEGNLWEVAYNPYMKLDENGVEIQD
jgi:catechol 2,3-dioxygenase-like lactoylglutathione lyase family enzyme